MIAMLESIEKNEAPQITKVSVRFEKELESC